MHNHKMHRPRFPIGTQYINQTRKNKYVETIVDVITWTNSANEVVGRRYVTEHEFMGQILVCSNVLETTIARSKILDA